MTEARISTGWPTGCVSSISLWSISGGVRYYLKAVDTEDNATIEPENAIEDFFEAFEFGVD